LLRAGKTLGQKQGYKQSRSNNLDDWSQSQALLDGAAETGT